jgi:hypothetical protein
VIMKAHVSLGFAQIVLVSNFGSPLGLMCLIHWASVNHAVLRDARLTAPMQGCLGSSGLKLYTSDIISDLKLRGYIHREVANKALTV